MLEVLDSGAPVQLVFCLPLLAAVLRENLEPVRQDNVVGLTSRHCPSYPRERHLRYSQGCAPGIPHHHISCDTAGKLQRSIA